MLDSRGGGSGSDYASDDSGAGDFGSQSPRARKPAAVGAGSRGDMDDEIPF
jgi:hypothetical protein